MFAPQSYISTEPLCSAVSFFRTFVVNGPEIRFIPQISFSAVAEVWVRSALNTRPYEPLSRRSFVRHRQSIAELIGLDVRCNKSSNTYYIAHAEKLEHDSIVARFVNTLIVEPQLRVNYSLKSLWRMVPDSLWRRIELVGD